VSTFPQDIHIAIDRYQGLVRAAEERAMHVAEAEPRRAAVIGNLYRGVARRLSARWANRVRAQFHSGAAQSDQVAG